MCACTSATRSRRCALRQPAAFSAALMFFALLVVLYRERRGPFVALRVARAPDDERKAEELGRHINFWFHGSIRRSADVGMISGIRGRVTLVTADIDRRAARQRNIRRAMG